MVRQFSRWAACRTDGIIAPTEKAASLLRRYKVPCPLYVVPAGIAKPQAAGQSESHILRKTLGIADNQTVLLYLGRLAVEKNCAELLRAMVRFQDAPVTLLLVGDGPDRRALERLSRQLNLDRHILFAGMVPPEQVGRYYQLGDLFVSTSTSETQGLTYMEALRAGLPLLCRRDACLDGVVSQGKNGWQHATEDDFTACVVQFLQHPEHRERMEKFALISGQRFSIEGFAQEIESVYLKCLYTRCWKAQGRT